MMIMITQHENNALIINMQLIILVLFDHLLNPLHYLSQLIKSGIFLPLVASSCRPTFSSNVGAFESDLLRVRQ